MIKFQLKCNSCSKIFDSWFSSSKEFEKLKKLNFLNCVNCNSNKVEKSLMAPNVFNTKDERIDINPKLKNIKKKKLKNIKSLLKIILSMWAIILHTRQDLFTIVKNKIKKVFTETHLRKILKS